MFLVRILVVFVLLFSLSCIKSVDKDVLVPEVVTPSTDLRPGAEGLVAGAKSLETKVPVPLKPEAAEHREQAETHKTEVETQHEEVAKLSATATELHKITKQYQETVKELEAANAKLEAKHKWERIISLIIKGVSLLGMGGIAILVWMKTAGMLQTFLMGLLAAAGVTTIWGMVVETFGKYILWGGAAVIVLFIGWAIYESVKANKFTIPFITKAYVESARVLKKAADTGEKYLAKDLVKEMAAKTPDGTRKLLENEVDSSTGENLVVKM